MNIFFFMIITSSIINSWNFFLDETIKKQFEDKLSKKLKNHTCEYLNFQEEFIQDIMKSTEYIAFSIEKNIFYLLEQPCHIGMYVASTKSLSIKYAYLGGLLYSINLKYIFQKMQIIPRIAIFNLHTIKDIKNIMAFQCKFLFEKFLDIPLLNFSFTLSIPKKLEIHLHLTFMACNVKYSFNCNLSNCLKTYSLKYILSSIENDMIENYEKQNFISTYSKLFYHIKNIIDFKKYKDLLDSEFFNTFYKTTSLLVHPDKNHKTQELFKVLSKLHTLYENNKNNHNNLKKYRNWMKEYFEQSNQAKLLIKWHQTWHKQQENI